jgi:hypothetical protein
MLHPATVKHARRHCLRQRLCACTDRTSYAVEPTLNQVADQARALCAVIGLSRFTKTKNVSGMSAASTATRTSYPVVTVITRKGGSSLSHFQQRATSRVQDFDATEKAGCSVGGGSTAGVSQSRVVFVFLGVGRL